MVCFSRFIYYQSLRHLRSIGGGLMKIFGMPILCGLCLCSCINNDVPYPVVKPAIKLLVAEGTGSVMINSTERRITLDLEEKTDIRAVRIKEVEFEDPMTESIPPMTGTFDLSSPVKFILRTYSDYNCVIDATQEIPLSFDVSGQIGSTFFDAINHRAVAKVSSKQSLSAISVTSLKLGPADISTYSKTPEQLTDFTSPQTVDVTCHGRTETWTLFIEQTESSVTLKGVDAWSRVVWLYAQGVEGQYKKTSDTEWTDVSGEAVKTSGGDFSACVEGLSLSTEYECYAYSGSDRTESRVFTTEDEKQLPNAGFEIFSQAESSNYYSFFDPSSSACPTKWWDSGNAGSTMVGATASICNPDTANKMEGNASARLNSKYVVIKFAAGNIFCGEFAGLVGTSGGKVNFGRPFTLRPRKMTFWMKYQGGAIDYVGGYPEGEPVKKGDPDACQVFVALGDWDYREYGGTKDCPVQVNTTRKETFFNPSGPNVIAYGSYITNSSTDGWKKIEIPLEYTTTSKAPTHIIISCASSMLGDYFTGCSTSTLWVDDFRLEY